MDQENYSETTSAMGRVAGVLPQTVVIYCDLGLLDHIRLANGVRLLKPSAAGRVREIYAERIARRGGSKRTAA
jgi:hypothetical protein